MRPLRRHPTFRKLSAYEDRELGAEERQSIAAHLQACTDCRKELSAIRSLSEDLRDVSLPRPPRSLRDDILAARAAGERVILPTTDPGIPRTGPRLVAVAVAAVLFAATAVAIGVLTSGEVSAGASTLLLGDGSDLAGLPTGVEYRGASILAGEEKLRLRARYRSADDELRDRQLGHHYQAELESSGAGSFEGSVSLPKSAVYAVFAVEDLDGELVDSHGRRFWEWLERDADGRPTADALIQKYRVFEERNPRLAYETALQLGQLYPERPEGWWFQAVYEGAAALSGDLEGQLESHRRTLARLDGSLGRRPDPGVREMVALIGYARELSPRVPEAREVMERWIRRLQDEHPGHDMAVRIRTFELLNQTNADAQALLSVVDSEWTLYGTVASIVPEAGLDLAIQTGDPAYIELWVGRFAFALGELPANVLQRLAGIPAVRAVAIEQIRRQLRSLRALDPARRSLDESVPYHLVEMEEEEGRLLAILGEALLANGQRSAALEALDKAAAVGWDPELFRNLADTRLAAADTAGALRLYAFAAVDPVEELRGAAAPSVPPFGYDEAAWPVLLDEARRELSSRLTLEAPVYRLPPDILVVDETGRQLNLRQLTDGTTSLVVYLYWISGSPGLDLPELARQLANLQLRGIRTLVVTREERSRELASTLSALEPPLAVFHDANGSSADALGAWLLRQDLVVDSAGNVRSFERDFNEAIRLALFLHGAG